MPDDAGILQPCAWKDVAAFVGRLGEEGGPLLTEVHPSDEMYLYERSIPYRSREAAAIGYFATGRQIFRTLREIVAWRFGGFDRVGAFLDFASGYGRVTRFLVRAMDPARISVAEVDAAAVRFQERTFGVRGVVSQADPERLPLEQSFDMKHLVDGVVRGIAGYGNCIGIPTLGGETTFHRGYDENILVNVMNLGIVRADRIFLGRAEGVGNPIVYVGSKTGRDGIHGATMASEEFAADEADQKRPTVQVGDPFTEKLLMFRKRTWGI